MSKMERLPDTIHGHGLWRRAEPHGGYSYWCDHIGGGALVWDDGLDDMTATLTVLCRAYGKARVADALREVMEDEMWKCLYCGKEHSNDDPRLTQGQDSCCIDCWNAAKPPNMREWETPK